MEQQELLGKIRTIRETTVDPDIIPLIDALTDKLSIGTLPTRIPLIEADFTIHDLFAAAALAGCLADGAANETGRSELAELAYDCADAMLEARKLPTRCSKPASRETADER